MPKSEPKSKQHFYLVAANGEFPTYRLLNFRIEILFDSLRTQEIISLQAYPEIPGLPSQITLHLRVIRLTAERKLGWHKEKKLYSFKAEIYDASENMVLGIAEGTFIATGFPGGYITGPIPIIFA